MPCVWGRASCVVQMRGGTEDFTVDFTLELSQWIQHTVHTTS